MDSFKNKLVVDFKMPEILAKDCSASYTDSEKKVILKFLSRYGSVLTIPYQRYGKR